MEGDFLAFVEGFAREIGLRGEDLFPWGPPALDPVALPGFVFGFFVFRAEVFQEGLVDRELVGADGLGFEEVVGMGLGELEEMRSPLVLLVLGFRV